MTRVQCIVVNGKRILMVRHRLDSKRWWCLPGGGLKADETPESGALRELREECNVKGGIVRQTAHVHSDAHGDTITFLVDIGNQTPSLGYDPEFVQGGVALIDEVRWLSLSEIPERDRVFLWTAGLLGVGDFMNEIQSWGGALSYPVTRQDESLS